MNKPALSLTLRMAALACAICTAACQAAEPAGREGGWYGGVTVSAATIKADRYDIDSSRDPKGHGSAGVFIGLRLASIPVSTGWPVDLEFGYQDIARHTLGYKTQGSITDLTARGQAVWVAGRVSMLQYGGFSAYTKLGLAHSRVEGSTPAGQPAIDIKGSRVGAMGALGVEQQFDSGVLLRGEITGYGKTSAHSSAAALTVGLGLRF